MSNNPLASCLCPTYNRPHLLNELVYCFLNQTYNNKELIILNDDPYVEYYLDEPNIKIINYKKRFNSLGEKRNESLKYINGDYVFFLDDDDIYYSNHLESLISKLKQNELYDYSKNKKYNFSINNKNLELVSGNTCFASMCFKNQFVSKRNFNLNKNNGEDLEFIEGAKELLIENEKPSFNYRWGMNIKHISGYGDNPESWKLSESENKEFRKIEIIPKLDNNTYFH